MPTLPAVEGLLKHQIYFYDPPGNQLYGVVMTIWTWRNENPVAPERIAYETSAIAGWTTHASFCNYFTNKSYATQIKTWDFGTSPPTRVHSQKLLPYVTGNSNSPWAPQLGVVVALRTQPIGSTIRNRLNGRLFHPFAVTLVSGVGLDNTGQWHATYRAGIETAYGLLVTMLNPANDPDSGTWVVPCFFEDGALRVGGPLLPEVDHIIARTYPGVRRSRLENNGPYAVGA